MLVPANKLDTFPVSRIIIFFCLQAVKQLHSAPLSKSRNTPLQVLNSNVTEVSTEYCQWWKQYSKSTQIFYLSKSRN